MFIYFLLSWIFGVVVRFLLTYAYDKSYDIHANIFGAVASLVLGLPVAFIFKATNLSGWLAYFIIAALGFLSKYGLEWLNKRRG